MTTETRRPEECDWARLQLCTMCGQWLPHDYVHWNGAFEQCEWCEEAERRDPKQNGRDPILGGTYAPRMGPIYSGPTLEAEHVAIQRQWQEDERWVEEGR